MLDIRETRKQLKSHPTKAETAFKDYLLSRHYFSFRTQIQIGFYIVDFMFPRKMLAVELDGGVHRFQTARDWRRDQFIRQFGFTVWRFPNEQVFRHPERLLNLIDAAPNYPKKIYRHSIKRADTYYERAVKKASYRA